MNIYDYFNSPDIAEHCQKIGHEFNPLEMAVIVSISHKTLKEKHAGYRQIIEEYPDMPIPESGGFLTACESLHQRLLEIIADEEESLRMFFTPEPNMVYRFTAWKIVEPHGGQQDYSKSSGQFTTFENALKEIKDWNSDDEYNHYPFSRGYRYTVYKHGFDEEDQTTGMHIEINADMEPLDIWCYYCNCEDDSRKRPESIDDICIYIPTPFEKGDILVDSKNIPFVFCDLLYWSDYYKVCPEGCCGFDMQADGHYFFEGKLITNHGFILSELRYYTDGLKGQERFLKYLSEFIKDKSGHYAWLFDVYEKFKLEAMCEKQNALFGHEYIKLEHEGKSLEEMLEIMM